jgi:hypothetical protein
VPQAAHCGRALALVQWLERNAAGVSWGIMRCEKKDMHMLPHSAKRTKLIERMLMLVYGRGKRG